MKKNFLILLLTLFSFFSFAEAQEVLVVRSLEIKPYDDALSGFKDSCNCIVTEFFVSELNNIDIRHEVSKIKPDIIVTMGKDALLRAKRVKTLPIIYLLVLNPQAILSGEKNIKGINMNIAPEKQLGSFQEFLPDLKRIFLLFDPAKTGFFVERARRAAEKCGIGLITREVCSPKIVPSALKMIDMQAQTDAFWMLPDTTVFCPETIEFLLLFSMENRIPILTFADKYVEMGALMSLNIDTYDLGKQAAEMAEKILAGKDINTLSHVEPRRSEVTINAKVINKLGVSINKVAQKDSDEY